MKPHIPVFATLILAIVACQPVTTAIPPSTLEAVSVTQAPTPSIAVPSATSAPIPEPTSPPTAIPAGLIQVDTLEQEVYPFEENGKGIGA